MSDAVMDERVQEEGRASAARFLAFVQQAADAAGVPCNTVVATNAHPYDAIVDTANKRGCDLIVMTARYRKGLVSLMIGDEASRVLHRASIPVLVFRALMSADHPDRPQARP
jgi:nucleotide-binding universal stress UspA family protein